MSGKQSLSVKTGDLLSRTARESELAAALLQALRSVDFPNVVNGSLFNWTCLLSQKRPLDHLTVPLGTYDNEDYSIAFQTVGKGSLNCADDSNALRDHTESFVSLGINTRDDHHSTLAVPAGRLVVGRSGVSNITKSRWVVLLAEDRSLWACFADGFDVTDRDTTSTGAAERYHQGNDNAFGAIQNNEQVVSLGQLDDIQFRREQVINANVLESRWYTTYSGVWNNGDIGQPMYSTVLQRLLFVDLSGITLPKYKKSVNFYKFVHLIQYLGFRSDLNYANQGIGVLDRPTTEAAYFRTLLDMYVRWDPTELTPFHPGREISEKQRMLSRALSQRTGVHHYAYKVRTDENGDKSKVATKQDDVEEYWRERAVESPGLNVEQIIDDYDLDHAGPNYGNLEEFPQGDPRTWGSDQNVVGNTESEVDVSMSDVADDGDANAEDSGGDDMGSDRMELDGGGDVRERMMNLTL